MICFAQARLVIFTAYNRPEQLIQNQLFDPGTREFIKLIKRMALSPEKRGVWPCSAREQVHG